MTRALLFLALSLLLVSAGCIVPEPQENLVPAPPGITETPPLAPDVTTQPVPPVVTTHQTPLPTRDIPRPATTAPALSLTPTSLPAEALNARIVDARNKLNNYIDSDIADTVITHPDGTQDCEVKISKELGYLIDMNTGESVFIKGDYWQIKGERFLEHMKKDRQYVIIHTHPRMWTTCGGSGLISLYTFSIGDLEAMANLTGQGYHVNKLIAIADKEYQIYPKKPDDWRSSREIYADITKIERFMDVKFSTWDPEFQRVFYDTDNLMPLLARELNYSYIVNNAVVA